MSERKRANVCERELCVGVHVYLCEIVGSKCGIPTHQHRLCKCTSKAVLHFSLFSALSCTHTHTHI